MSSSPWITKLREAIAGTDARTPQQAAAHSIVQLAKATDARFDELEARVAAQEARPRGLNYVGVYSQGKEYERDCGVTFGGSLWCAVVNTRGVPGQCDDWQLCARKGRDGKDGR